MIQQLWPNLSAKDHATIYAMGLRYIMFMPEIQANTGLLTALTERWYLDTFLFHLSMGEMSVTLDDVY